MGERFVDGINLQTDVGSLDVIVTEINLGAMLSELDLIPSFGITANGEFRLPIQQADNGKKDFHD